MTDWSTNGVCTILRILNMLPTFRHFVFLHLTVVLIWFCLCVSIFVAVSAQAACKLWHCESDGASAAAPIWG